MKELLLGVGREIITPKIGARLHGYGPNVYSESVADDLTATAFYFKQGELKATTVTTKLPLSPKLSRNEAEAIYEEYKHYKGGWQMMRGLTALATTRAWEAGEPDLPFREAPQTMIGLGNLIMVGFPFEMFSQISMRIDEAFPDQSILTLSITNGADGYFITEDAICRGGYEVSYFLAGSVQPFTRDGDYHITCETVNNIQNFKGE